MLNITFPYHVLVYENVRQIKKKKSNTILIEWMEYV